MRLGAWTAVAVGAVLLAGCKGDDVQTVKPDERGERGESCQARNDCAEGLACVLGVCTQNEFPISVHAKHCYKVECAENADCCVDFVPTADEDTCTLYAENCATDAYYCDLYNTLCICSEICIEERCVPPPSACIEDLDCYSEEAVDGMGVCEDGKCYDCREDANCAVAGAECVDMMCEVPCTRHEQCGLFEDCIDGDCVDRGCANDRECVFLYGLNGDRPQPRCRDGECEIPCENDAQCRGLQEPNLDPAHASFYVCEGGRCVFMGCTTDEQCRIMLDLQYEEGLATAVCREPPE
jgi:hypothetical protein